MARQLYFEAEDLVACLTRRAVSFYDAGRFADAIRVYKLAGRASARARRRFNELWCMARLRKVGA